MMPCVTILIIKNEMMPRVTICLYPTLAEYSPRLLIWLCAYLISVLGYFAYNLCKLPFLRYSSDEESMYQYVQTIVISGRNR